MTRCKTNIARVVTHSIVVQQHLELLKEHPPLSFFRVQIVKEIARRKPERVELTVGFQQEGGGRLLVNHPRVATLPLPHHVHVVFGISRETECVAGKRRAEIDGDDDKLLAIDTGRARFRFRCDGRAHERRKKTATRW